MKKTKENSTRELLSNTFFALRFIYKVNKKLFFVRIPLMLIQTASALLPVIFIRQILNEITIGKDMKLVMFYAVLLAVLYFVFDMANNLLSNYDSKNLEKSKYAANLKFNDAVMSMPYSQLETPRIRDFINLARSSDNLFGILYTVTGILSGVLNFFSFSIIVLTVQPLILFFILFIITMKMVINRVRRKVFANQREDMASFSRKMSYYSFVNATPEYGKENRVNGLGKWMYDRYINCVKTDFIPLFRRYNKKFIRMDFISDLFVIFQEAIIYFILGYKVVFSHMPVGDFSMYLTSVKQFSSSVEGIVGNFSGLITQGLFVKEFRYFIDLQEKNEKLEGSNVLDMSHGCSVEFRNVSFHYPNSDNMVLKNVSFQLAADESLSLVGVNGAGKTTLVKLLCRFYEPTEGEILVNGVPLQTIRYEDVHRFIGVVFQDFRLFSFSVRENIELDTQKGDDGRLYSAIEKSGLSDKIKTLPNDVDTMLNKEFDEKGIEFSGGEGQKLAIARAIYKDAPLIILDEPTSALDPIAEYDIYRRFDNLTEGKSAIYISHRLSSTRFTDKIAVLVDGQIAEFGNHSDLIKLENGVYKEMFEMQAQYYQE